MSELATVLRAWRDRVSPVEAGLPAGGDRRSPGLRREELAMLAGLSVDYIVRLEQGRASHPSAQVLAALARALRLSEHERDHLFRAGGVAVPSRTMVPRHVTPGVQHIVDRLGEVPVAVFSAAWDTLLVNDLWVTVFDEEPLSSGRTPNLLWRAFVSGTGRTRHTPELLADLRRALVSDAHLAVTKYPDDPALATLISDLRATSDEFERLWSQAALAAHVESRKVVDHPVVGPIVFDCDVLTAPGGDVRIVVYTVIPGSEDSAKLDLLKVSAVRAFAD